MTRKDFQQIASAIAATLAQPYYGRDATFAIYHIARNLAETFKQLNPRFNRERFLKACNVPESQEDSDETS